MEQPTNEDILKEIFARAEERQFTKFRFIRNLEEFAYWLDITKANKLIIKTLIESANNLFKKYCKDVVGCVANSQELFAYTELRDIIKFYETELVTINSMTAEYKDYLCHGNFINALLGEERDV
jgi:hypothetical protein